MNLKMRLLVETLTTVGNAALVPLPWLVANLDGLFLLQHELAHLLSVVVDVSYHGCKCFGRISLLGLNSSHERIHVCCKTIVAALCWLGIGPLVLCRIGVVMEDRS